MKVLLSLFIFTALLFTQTFAIQLSISPEDNICLLDYYGRKPAGRPVVGYVSGYGCEGSLELVGQYCYQACAKGYQAFGQTCVGVCPAGYTQCDEFCTKGRSCESSEVKNFEAFIIAIHEASEKNGVKVDLSNLNCAQAQKRGIVN